MFDFTFLGTLAVSHDKSPFVDFPTDKTRALLAYLALEPARPHRRERLAALLWPDHGRSGALLNLRLTLYRLRQTLAHAAPDATAQLFSITRQTICFTPVANAVQIDALTFQTLLLACEQHDHVALRHCSPCLQRLAQATALYQGELLAGFGVADAPEFEEWLLMRRQTLYQQALLTLSNLANAHEERLEYAQAQSYATRGLALDAYREDMHRQVIRSLARRGLLHQALAHYETCRRLLHDELGVEPETATVALYDQICGGAFQQGDHTPFTAIDEHARATDPGIFLANANQQEWGEPPETGHGIYGRQTEMATLQQWLEHERCQLIAILGIGGVGKTTLAATIAKMAAADLDQTAQQKLNQHKVRWDKVIWRSLLNAPTLDELLRGLLPTIVQQPLIEWPPSLDGQLALLLHAMRQQRCLLVFDNVESILQAQGTGQMRAGYEGYAQLIRLLAESKHNSTLLLTSRERPQGLARWRDDLPWVHTLHLEGIEPTAVEAMLLSRGLNGHADDLHTLAARYSGHPLALKLVAETVQELFGGVIDDFLQEEAPIFGDIRVMLDAQFTRLSPLEQELLFWLAIERQPVMAATLRANLIQKEPAYAFLDALHSLERRSLLEKVANGFTLPNVIIEYLTARLIDAVCHELLAEAEQPGEINFAATFLNRFALLQAQAKEYVRRSQARLILQSICEELLQSLGDVGVEKLLQHTLAALRLRGNVRLPGYAAGNLLNLLLHLGLDLTAYDFSFLCVWQAYLRGAYLPKLNFTGADLTGSVFTSLLASQYAIEFNRQGELLVADLGKGRLRLWRAAGSILLKDYAVDDLMVQSLFLNAGATLLAVLTTDFHIHLFDLERGTLRHTLVRHHHPVWRLRFSMDGKWLATGDAGGRVCIWDSESGCLRRELQGSSTSVTALAFTPDGQRLATATITGAVFLWDVGSGTLIQTLQGHTEEVAALEFLLDGELLASGSHDATVGLWEVASGQLRQRLTRHTRPIRHMATSGTGRILITGGGDPFCYVWDIQAGVARHVLANLAASLARLSLSPDGSKVATIDRNTSVALWDVHHGWRLDFYQIYRTANLYLDFSPDGQSIVSGGAGYAVYLWDLADPQAARVVARLHKPRPGMFHIENTWHSEAIVAFSVNGALIASNHHGHTICLWDRHSHHLLHTLSGHTSDINSLAFSPDSTLLASSSDDRALYLWDVQSGQKVRELHGHANLVTCCSFSPVQIEIGGATVALLASGSLDHRVLLWDAARGTLLHTLQGHTNAVMRCVFSADGRRLVTTGFDQSVRFWDTASGELLATWPTPNLVYITLALHPQGELLAATGSDYVIRLIDLHTGAVLCELVGHSDVVRCIRFSPDGKILASASADETIKLWDVPASIAAENRGVCVQILRPSSPYTGMKISGITGITEAQKASLRSLGATEIDEAMEDVPTVINSHERNCRHSEPR